MSNLDFGDAKSLLLSLRQIETGGLVAGQNNLGFPSSSSTTRKLGNTRAGGGRVVERSLPKKNRPVHDAMDNAENSDLGRTHPTSKRSVVDVMMDSEGSSAADTPYHHPGQLVRGTSTSSSSGAIQVFPEHISTKKKTASYLVQPNADGGVALLKAKTSPFVLHDDLAKMSLQQYQQQQQHQQMQQLQQLQIQQQQQQVLLQQQLQQMRQQPPQLTQPPMMMTSTVTSHGTPHYINPPRAVQQEQEKLTGNLRVDMLQLQHSLAKNSKTVDKSIASTIKFLPVSMLNDKNNPVKIRQRNAALARALLIYRPYHARLMLRKLTHWWKVITEQKEALAAEKLRVAQHVREQAEIALGNFARFYRGFIARRRVRILRKERHIELELGRERFERERMAEEEVLTRRTSTRYYHDHLITISSLHDPLSFVHMSDLTSILTPLAFLCQNRHACVCNDAISCAKNTRQKSPAIDSISTCQRSSVVHYSLSTSIHLATTPGQNSLAKTVGQRAQSGHFDPVNCSQTFIAHYRGQATNDLSPPPLFEGF